MRIRLKISRYRTRIKFKIKWFKKFIKHFFKGYRCNMCLQYKMIYKMKKVNTWNNVASINLCANCYSFTNHDNPYVNCYNCDEIKPYDRMERLRPLTPVLFLCSDCNNGDTECNSVIQ